MCNMKPNKSACNHPQSATVPNIFWLIDSYLWNFPSSFVGNLWNNNNRIGNSIYACIYLLSLVSFAFCDDNQNLILDQNHIISITKINTVSFIYSEWLIDWLIDGLIDWLKKPETEQPKFVLIDWLILIDWLTKQETEQQKFKKTEPKVNLKQSLSLLRDSLP